MEKLAILDYITQTIHIYNVDHDVDINEEYLSNLDFKTAACSWICAEELSIIHHKEILK